MLYLPHIISTPLLVCTLVLSCFFLLSCGISQQSQTFFPWSRRKVESYRSSMNRDAHQLTSDFSHILCGILTINEKVPPDGSHVVSFLFTGVIIHATERKSIYAPIPLLKQLRIPFLFRRLLLISFWFLGFWFRVGFWFLGFWFPVWLRVWLRSWVLVIESRQRDL